MHAGRDPAAHQGLEREDDVAGVLAQRPELRARAGGSVIVPGALELIVDADSIHGDRSVSVIMSIDDDGASPGLKPACCMLPTRSGGVLLYSDMLRFDPGEPCDTEYVLP